MCSWPRGDRRFTSSSATSSRSSLRAALGAVELGQDSSPVAVVIEVGEGVEGFRYPAKFCHRTAQRGWPAASLQDAKKL